LNPKEVFILSIDALNDRKVRTLLTVLMVVVGSSLMVVLNGLSAGQLAFTQQQLNQLADNVLTVTPGQRSFRSVDTTTTSILINSVVVSRIDSLPYVDEVVPQYTGSMDLSSQGTALRTSVISMDPEKVYVMLPNLKLTEGSVIKKTDPSAILVGYSVANPDGSTFPIISVGQTIKASRTYVDDNGKQQTDSRIFSVSGIMELTGNPQMDRSVIINQATGNTFLQKSGKYDRLWVVASSSELVDVVEKGIKDLYGSTIGVSSLQSNLQFRQEFVSGFNSFILSIGVIALIVGAVGIITTLYTSVNERVKEIGTMKAIGAQSTNILSLFLVEAFLIGILGGTLGIIIGISAGYGLGSMLFSFTPGGGPSITPIFLPVDLVKVWLLSVGLSIAAGIFPAWKASQLSPLVALRRE
jgi:putative ABC transport system permease protein